MCSYVPPCTVSPLHLEMDDGTPIASRSFLVRGWGGVYVHRGPEKTLCAVGRTAKRQTLSLDLQPALSAFRPLLLHLLELPESDRRAVGARHGVTLNPGFGNGLPRWDLQRILQQRVVRHIDSAMSAMLALHRSTTSVDNIVVTTETAAKVAKSSHAVRRARELAGRGRLNEAVALATSASQLAGGRLLCAGSVAAIPDCPASLALRCIRTHILHPLASTLPNPQTLLSTIRRCSQ